MKQANSEKPSERALNSALRSLSRKVVPPAVSASLRVMASRESLRQRNRRTFGSAFAAWWDRTHLLAHNLMRPLALPAVGGLFSAVALFGMWLVPTYPLRGNNTFDVPTGLSTNPVLR